MPSPPRVCHLPNCSGIVSTTKPRKLRELAYAFCVQHNTLELGAEQDGFLCTPHYNSMYTNPSRSWRQQEGDAAATSTTRSRRRSIATSNSSLDDVDFTTSGQ